MERQAKETLLRFPYIPKKEARTVAWSNLKFISHLYLQSCKLLEHLCYTAQENYLNKAVQTHVWNVCRQTNRMSVIPFPSALWSWIHVTRSYHFRLLMLCPVHLNPPETEILQVLLNADCCNALLLAEERSGSRRVLGASSSIFLGDLGCTRIRSPARNERGVFCLKWEADSVEPIYLNKPAGCPLAISDVNLYGIVKLYLF
ncbi:uncharacterized protein [Aphelocoma coerulescens]|uniref:uncharacterized protein isoform X3 n=2 Tax=Aphelocoma coerulescens TaxID=39617 RepID=UPI003604675A